MSTPNIGLTQPSNGSFVNTWDAPLNANFTSIDNAFGGTVTINAVGASGFVNLTSGQYVTKTFFVTGALTANVTYVFPAGVGGIWIVENNTTGAYNVAFGSNGGGATVTAGQGLRSVIFSDGISVLLASPESDPTYFYANTPPTGDSSSKIANTQFVANSQIGGQIVLSASATLNSAQTMPNNILLSISSGGVITFPSSRLTFSLNNIGSGAITLSFPGGTDYKASLNPGETVILAGDGTGYWRVIANGFSSGYVTGYRNVPLSANSTPSAMDVGKFLYVSSSTTISSGIFAVGDAFLVVNSSSTPITLTQGSGATLIFAGAGTTGNRTLAGYGEASLLCVASNTFYVSGAGVS